MATFTNTYEFFTTCTPGDTCTTVEDRETTFYYVELVLPNKDGSKELVFHQATTRHHSKRYNFTYATSLYALVKPGADISLDPSDAMQRTRDLMAPVDAPRFNAKTMGKHHTKAVDVFCYQVLAERN